MTPEEAAGKSPWRDLKEGLAHVWNTPILLALVWLAFLANLVGVSAHQLACCPMWRRTSIGLDQTGLGYLVASFAGGALIGSIVLSHVSNHVRLTRLMIVATVLWYAMLLAFAQMPAPRYGDPVPDCWPASCRASAWCRSDHAAARSRARRFRGRVMGVRMMAIYSLPLGLLAAGPLIDWIGFRGTASLYAIIGIVFTLIIALRWRAELWRA